MSAMGALLLQLHSVPTDPEEGAGVSVALAYY